MLARRRWIVSTGIALAVVLLAWAVRMYRLDAQSLWYDEGYSAYVAALSPVEIIRWIARDFTPPLYNLLLALWLPLVGWSEFGLRFLSVFCGTLVVAGMVRLGAELCSRRAGLAAGALTAFSVFYVWHSQDARMYMPQALLGLLAALFLVWALRNPRRWTNWGALALVDALTLYTHTAGGFLIVFHAGVVAAAGARSASRLTVWVRGGLALAGALLAWVPWMIGALPFLGQNAGYWPGMLSWQFVFAGAFHGFVTGQMVAGAAESAALVVWGLAALGGLLALLFRRQGWRTALFLLAYFVLPVAAMAVLFRNVAKFSPRYLIVASPPVLLLPAVGVAELWRHRLAWRVVGALALAALVVTAGLGLGNMYFDPAFAKSDFRAAARMVREQIAPDEVVLVVPGHTFPVWQYYYGPEGWVPLPDDPILDVTHTLHYRNTVDRLNRVLTGRGGVWLVEWEPWVVDPTDLAVHLLEQVGEEVALPQEPHGLRLRYYRLQVERLPLPAEPAISPPPDSLLDLPLALAGCDIPDRVPGDEAVQAGCYWEAYDSLPLHLSVSARLMDTAGVEWGRADAAISGPYLVAGRWPQHELVLGQYAVAPFPGIPPGDFYRLELLVYGPDGTRYGTVVAGPVTIDRPSRPFAGVLPADGMSLGSIGDLVLASATVSSERVLPGEEVWIEATWQVGEVLREPVVMMEDVLGGVALYPLLPQSGATEVWQAGDAYRTITRVPISPRAYGGPVQLSVASQDGELPIGTVQVDVSRTFALPEGVPTLDYRLGDAISLAGAQFSVERGEAGRIVRVVLYWRAEETVDQSYTAFVHLAGSDGAIVDGRVYAQVDSSPQGGRHPTNHWLSGEVVDDAYRLECPVDAPAGTYRVLVGLYDLATMERLPVFDADGNAMPNDAIQVGELELP